MASRGRDTKRQGASRLKGKGGPVAGDPGHPERLSSQPRLSWGVTRGPA